MAEEHVPLMLFRAIADIAALAWARQAKQALRDPERVKFPRWP